MKNKIYQLFPFILVIFLMGCSKRNYFPDQDDPGLSRFTNYGFNIATSYINKVAYINDYRRPYLGGGIINSVPTIHRIVTSSTFDTLSISWPIGINDNGEVEYNSPYRRISLLMPVSKSFTARDFSAMNGKRFASDNSRIVLNANSYNDTDSLHGTANIYFVKIDYLSDPDPNSRKYAISGLFNGNIGDSILITKGRFDFKIDANQVNF